MTLITSIIIAGLSLQAVFGQNIADVGKYSIAAPDNRIVCLERPHVLPYPANANTDGAVGSEVALNNGNKITITRALRNPFCAGHAQAADGNILVIGGDYPEGYDSAGNMILVNGVAARRKYVTCAYGDTTCVSGSWQFDSSDMTTGRWYPTVTTLFNGQNIIVSGGYKNLDFANLTGTNNPTYEYYPSKTGAWPRLLDALNWAFPFNLYPAVFQLNTGKVMMFVSNRTTIIDPVTDEYDTSIPDAIIEDKLPWIYPYTPTFVMLPLTKRNNYKSQIMACGGTRPNNDADNRCISINFADEAPAWKLTNSPMPVGRLMPDSVILPDGTIFFCNGASFGVAGGAAGDAVYARKPVFVNHIFNPETSTWTDAGTMTVPRLYHSGALLLEDGSVLITGSEEQNYVDIENNRQDCYPYVMVACTSPFEYRMERYEPAYLHKGISRPIIATAPRKITYSSTFGITLDTATTEIYKVSFIRYSTTTHSTNTDQRLVELNIVAMNTTYMLLEAPATGFIAPPGNYHLFIVKDGGVPSISKTILLGDGDVVNDAQPINQISLRNAAVEKYSFQSTLFVAVSLALAYLF